jgi:hypothetical protein
MCSDTRSTVVPASRIRSRRGTTEFVFRFLLAGLAVTICYCFRWEFLRFLTMELNLRLDALAGVHLQRITFDTVAWNGATYHYAIACTMADVWCGAIPLIWDIRSRVVANLRYLAILTVALFTFNVFRLSVSDVLVAAGLSWDLGHNVISGVAYFLIWTIIRKRTKSLVYVGTNILACPIEAENVGTDIPVRSAVRSTALSR